MRHNLIVSKNPELIVFLRERYLGELLVTDDPTVAIEVLGKEPFDRVFLDHWLDKEPKNGRDVSIWLGAHKDINPLMQVIATTDDVKKGRQMVAESGRLRASHITFDTIQDMGK